MRQANQIKIFQSLFKTKSLPTIFNHTIDKDWINNHENSFSESVLVAYEISISETRISSYLTPVVFTLTLWRNIMVITGRRLRKTAGCSGFRVIIT